MGNVPKPRKPGQTGGGGRINQTSNRAKSSARGGRPHAGGGGTGKKPGSGGGTKATVFIAIGLLAVPASAIAGVAAFILHGYGVI